MNNSGLVMINNEGLIFCESDIMEYLEPYNFEVSEDI